ncbi:hypothetical protein KFK09_012329 [Dendrobium nobile]|uniref:Uncharacterized protein n=1 Tax=Dendrobium nobile TaxID=94219 RepID=A0A8T3BHK3_DENNO|nr:hypothetical protein KFK09_012329 [Dendrobium nobile]
MSQQGEITTFDFSLGLKFNLTFIIFDILTPQQISIHYKGKSIIKEIQIRLIVQES